MNPFRKPPREVKVTGTPLKASLRAVEGDQAQKGVCKGPLTTRKLGAGAGEQGWWEGLSESGGKSLQRVQHLNACRAVRGAGGLCLRRSARTEFCLTSANSRARCLPSSGACLTMTPSSLPQFMTGLPWAATSVGCLPRTKQLLPLPAACACGLFTMAPPNLAAPFPLSS